MFFNQINANFKPINNEYHFINDMNHFYQLLLSIWCKKTCAPRMRIRWTNDNPSLGQCSITSFLCQDIFGGEVYGVMLKDGNLHCFNYINGVIFDLTSEQLNEEVNYSLSLLQNRNDHFVSEEKYQRYLLLKKLLQERK